MTATMPRTSRHESLQSRLETLRTERTELLAELTAPSSGDDADRATNVDGHVRLGMLEQRIVSIEAELAEPNRARTREADGTAAVGDIVTVDLGDGPEKFLLGSIEQAGEDLDVISPSSPLGKVLQGASVGTTLSYSARPGRKLQATVIALD